MDKVLIKTIFYIILVCIVYYVYITYDDNNYKENNGKYTKLNNDNKQNNNNKQNNDIKQNNNNKQINDNKQNNDSKNNNNKLNNKYNMEMIIIIEGLNNNLNNLDKILKRRDKEDFTEEISNINSNLPTNLDNDIDEWNSYFNHDSEEPEKNFNLIKKNIEKIRDISENNRNINMHNILQNNKHLQHMIQNMNYNLVDNVGKLLYKVDKVNLHRQANMRADNEFPLRE